jgi:FdhE protein
MTIRNQDLQVLHALEAAWQRRKELADLLYFYHSLYELQFRVKADASDPEVRDEMARRWRLEGGIPQLTFDQLRLEAEPFGHLVEEISHLFSCHSYPALGIAEGEHTPQELVALAQEVFETWDTLTVPGSGGQGVAGSPTIMAVGFALAPYLQRAAEVILPYLDLTLWMRGYCPVCGGRPYLALLPEEGETSRLVCCRCNTTWPYVWSRCPFCGSENVQMRHFGGDDTYQAQVCENCHQYLKIVDLAKAQPPVYPQVERLLTIGLDLAVRQEE